MQYTWEHDKSPLNNLDIGIDNWQDFHISNMLKLFCHL